MSEETIIALAGNPNVGKSTVFNALTGLKQHTGNWAGKTVAGAEGKFSFKEREYVIMDTPGTHSLIAHSHEEEVAANMLAFGGAKGIVVVCDALALERGLCLAVQISELTGNVILFVNLMDDAEKAGIEIDANALSKRLGCPVILAAARSGRGLNELKESLSFFDSDHTALKLSYDEESEKYIKELLPYMPEGIGRFCALRLLEGNGDICKEILKRCDDKEKVEEILLRAEGTVELDAAQTVSEFAKSAAEECLITKSDGPTALRLKIDKLLTGRFTGLPLMLLLLAVVFYITVSLANYPSELLSKGLFWIGDKLREAAEYIGTPPFIIGVVFDGAYRVSAWVVSVMLPPMAIFFPLFTLLEDAGFLPRVAFNMDSAFEKCSACGKQSLTMCMGLGCNAVGVTGCRIIDSPRERLIAVLTNSMMPCNGRFPAMIMLTSLFVAKGSGASALVLTAVLALGVSATFLSSKLLSLTVLKGQASSFTLELPPFRKPKIGEVLVRSILDRTLFVLKRAVLVALPAGIIMWLLANIKISGATLLSYICNFLEPAGKLLGMDGELLSAFILGLPANEIVIPIAAMAYTGAGTISEASATGLGAIFSANGWTVVTAVCVMIFSLLHWPCATTLGTIKHETGKVRYVLLAVLLPTILGTILCILINFVSKLF